MRRCDNVCGISCSVSVPDTWIQFSETNIRRSQSERAASRDIRSQIDQLVHGVTTSIASEWNAVNSAFSDRVAEYVDARNKIQAHLSKVSCCCCVFLPSNFDLFWFLCWRLQCAYCINISLSIVVCTQDGVIAAGPRLWNNLPPNVRQLKGQCCKHSYSASHSTTLCI